MVAPANGSVAIFANGTFAYTPNTGFVGTDTFSYQVCDDGNPSECSIAVVTVIVNAPPNTAPIAVDDNFTVLQNVTFSGNILPNDSDPESDSLVVSISPISLPSNGTVTLYADGLFIYTPNPGFLGTDSFVYQICDFTPNPLCDNAVVYLTVVDNLNNAPIANADAISTDLDVPISGNVLTNDSDPDGDNLAVTLTPVVAPSNGIVTLSSNGDYTYTPSAGFLGMDSFVYELCDDGDSPICVQGTVTITVALPSNTPPTPQDDYVTAPVDGYATGNVAANDSDPEGDALSVSSFAVIPPDNGSVFLFSNGGFTYYPSAGFVGTDSFAYEVCDDGSPSLCSTAIVFVTVYSGTNAPPTAQDDTFFTPMNTNITDNVLTNDNDPDGNNMTVNQTPISSTANGTLTLFSNGGFVYSPNTNFVGTDSFIYEVCDDGTPVECAQATVTISVDPVSTNTAPIAQDDVGTTPYMTGYIGDVLGNDSDPDGDNLFVTTLPVSMPTNGTLDLNTDGSYLYTPNAGFLGMDSFVYELCDDGAPVLCDNAVVVITVESTNNPPIAINDNFAISYGITITTSVLPNDSDPDGDNLFVQTPLISLPSNGTASIDANGDFTYVHDVGFYGQDSFVYEICDDGIPVLCTQATIYVIVNPPYNTAPIAEDDVIAGSVDIPLNGNVLTNDSDPDGDNILYTNTITAPSNGSLAINPDGTFTYTPNSGYSGGDSFVYEICDDAIAVMCDQATVTITIDAAVNYPPLAVDDNVTTSFNTALVIDVLDNDSEPNGDNLNLTGTTLFGPFNGTVSFNGMGGLVYTPNTDFVGADSLGYEVCDDQVPMLCDSALVYISVTTSNTPPLAQDNSYQVNAGDNLTGDLLTNDLDPDGDNLTANTTPIVAPTLGTLTLNADGTFSYLPNASANGTDTFIYEVCDDGAPSLCDQATVYIEITQPNIQPTSGTDAYYTSIDVPITGNVTDNDSDANGDNLVVSTPQLSGPTNGTLVLNPDGSFVYTPNSGYVGTDVFVYEVCDDGIPIKCVLGFVNIVVENVLNQPPVALDDNYTLNEDDTWSDTMMVNDSDPEGDELTMTATPITPPANGTIVMNTNGTFTYTPEADFNGQDSLVYEVCDDSPQVNCTTAIAYFEVLPINDPPVAVTDSVTAVENIPLVIAILANDYDVDGGIDTSSIVLTSLPPANQGVVTISPDGSLLFTPATGFFGTVDPFYYEICDTGTPLPSLCATAGAIIITVEEGNKPPVGNNDDYTTSEDIPILDNVLVNDTDPDGDGLVVTTTPVVFPNNGTLVLQADGAFTYTPNDDYTGTDFFIYEVCHDQTPVLCDVGVVNITISPFNDPPDVVDDFFNTQEELTLNGNVLINDTDPENDNITINTTPLISVMNGILNMNADGSFVYSPNTNFSGLDSFEYLACDDGVPVACDTGLVNIMVIPINDAPIALDDYWNTVENVAISDNVLSNDVDPDNDSLVLVMPLIVQPSNGTVLLSNDGMLEYTPNLNYYGTDSFAYQVCDTGNPMYCTLGTVFVNVGYVNSPPIAVNDTLTIQEDVSGNGNVLSNDNEPDGEDLVLNQTLILAPSNGTVLLDSSGIFIYTPDADFNGVDSFIYEICDDSPNGYCDQATVLIIVEAVNDEPNLADDYGVTTMDVPLSVPILNNDGDIDGSLDINTLSLVSSPPATEGTVTLNPDKTITFTPAPGFAGSVTPFSYAICDNGEPLPAECSVATVYIEVLQDNRPPIAVDDYFETTEDAPATGNVLDNDTDPDGDNLTINTVPVISPLNGTVTLNTDGSFTYVPNTGYLGNDTFAYAVCDDGNPVLCEEGIVVIYVSDCPVAAFNIPTICIGESILFIGEDQGPGSLYSWDFGPGASPQLANARVTFVEFTQSGIQDVTLTVVKNGCTVMTTQQVTVNEIPFIDTGDDITFCKGDSVILGGIPTGPQGSTYFWSPNTGLSANDVANPRASPSVTTTYTLFVTLGSCTEVSTVTLTPIIPPVAQAGADTYVCSGAGTQIGDPNGAQPGLTYSWTPAASLNDPTIANPIASPLVNTVYTVSVIEGGCTSQDQVLVEVAPAPVAGAGQDTIICYDLNGPGVKLGNLDNDPFALYQWSPTLYLDDPFAANPVATPQATTTYVMTAIKFGCFISDTITVGVGSCDGPPVAIDDNLSTMEDQAVTFNVLSNDYSIGGYNIMLNTVVQDPSNGTITNLLPNGDMTYTPALNFEGLDTLIYQICDDNIIVQCTTGMVIINVLPENDPPIAVDDTDSTMVNTILMDNVLENDSDPENGVLVVNTVPVVSTENGNLLLSTDGSYTYTPDEDFFGIDQFTYEVCDEGTPVACTQAQVFIVVGDILNLQLYVWLEGPYDAGGDSMRTVLNTGRHILPGQSPTNQLVPATPAGQPFNKPPWNYAGTEGSEFNDSSYVSTVVDWLLVSLRTSTDKTTEVAQQAALLHSNGMVEFLSLWPSSIDKTIPYYVVIEHRNHMGVMSAELLSISSGTIYYDFRIADSYRNTTSFGQKELIPGKWAMFTGDGEQIGDLISFDINGQDKIVWNIQNGNFDRYIEADYNLDGDVSGQDKILWNGNNGVSSRVPK